MHNYIMSEAYGNEALKCVINFQKCIANATNLVVLRLIIMRTKIVP